MEIGYVVTGVQRNTPAEADDPFKTCVAVESSTGVALCTAVIHELGN